MSEPRNTFDLAKAEGWQWVPEGVPDRGYACTVCRDPIKPGRACWHREREYVHLSCVTELLDKDGLSMLCTRAAGKNESSPSTGGHNGKGALPTMEVETPVKTETPPPGADQEAKESQVPETPLGPESALKVIEAIAVLNHALAKGYKTIRDARQSLPADDEPYGGVSSFVFECHGQVGAIQKLLITIGQGLEEHHRAFYKHGEIAIKQGTEAWSGVSVEEWQRSVEATVAKAEEREPRPIEIAFRSPLKMTLSELLTLVTAKPASPGVANG